MDETTVSTVRWNPLLESYFADTGEKSYCYAILHKKAEAMFSRRTVFIDLPCIILATLNGATSIGSTALFGNDNMASVGIGLVALFTAILQTIGSYFSWARRAEAHRIASLNYAKLHRFLKIEMGLPRESRMKPKELLKNIKEQYDRLAEVSPLIPNSILIDFKKVYDKPEYKDIARPEESNGLETIIVYDPSKDTERAAALSPPPA